MSDSTRQLRVHLHIHGHVQGVWFREATRLEAERLGVAGWVKNCADGTVEAVIEGETGSVLELERWCRHGPSSAHVTEVQRAEEPPVGEKRFVVKH